MAKCKHLDICGLNADFHDGLCILHSALDKNKNEFAKRFEEHRKNKGDNFRYFVFPERIDFGGTTFTTKASFVGATFTEEAYFTGATFTKEAYFLEATFAKWTSFAGATFAKEAYFTRVTFSEEAYFTGATFVRGASFEGAIFEKGDVSFDDSHLLGRTLFLGGKTD